MQNYEVIIRLSIPAKSQNNAKRKVYDIMPAADGQVLKRIDVLKPKYDRTKRSCLAHMNFN